MIEGRIRHRLIVAPDRDPQSTCLNDLNRVIEADHVVWRTSFYMETSRGAIHFTVNCRVKFVLVGEACNFDIAKVELTDQTIEHHEPFRPLDSIVVEMSVSGENYIDPDGGKLA